MLEHQCWSPQNGESSSWIGAQVLKTISYFMLFLPPLIELVPHTFISPKAPWCSEDVPIWHLDSQLAPPPQKIPVLHRCGWLVPEPELTSQKIVLITGQIESALAEARIIAQGSMGLIQQLIHYLYLPRARMETAGKGSSKQGTNSSNSKPICSLKGLLPSRQGGQTPSQALMAGKIEEEEASSCSSVIGCTDSDAINAVFWALPYLCMHQKVRVKRGNAF